MQEVIYPATYKSTSVSRLLFSFKIICNEIDCLSLLQKLKCYISRRLVRFNPPICVSFSSSKYRKKSFIFRASGDSNKLCKEYSLILLTPILIFYAVFWILSFFNDVFFIHFFIFVFIYCNNFVSCCSVF